MSETRKERTNSTTAENHLKPPSSNDEASIAHPVVEGNGSSCGDESLDSQGNFGLTTSHCSSPPRTYNSTSPNKKSTTSDHPAALEPPVTNKTLSELDVNKIVHNPKLRHDINFDPDLHFRPNLDGEKGRRKTEKQDGFYETMRIQLGSFLADQEGFERQLRPEDADWCLPATLTAIRGILETLVPQRDRSSVEESFNVDLLMQQFRKGVANLPKLAEWLSQLLKCHCAPMRDPWVDEMVMQISKGDQERDVALLVLGMRNLLGVLEAMKLDVANHQIRCLRPLLIEDTVHFEQKFFLKKIATGRIDIDGARTWFERAKHLPEIGLSPQPHWNFWNFMKALVNLTLQSKAHEMVPHTFLFDEERIIKLRADTEDLIKLEICLRIFHDLERDCRIQSFRLLASDDTPNTSAVGSPYSSPSSPADSTVWAPHATVLQLSDHFTERGYFRTVPFGQQKFITGVEDEAISSSAFRSPHSSPSSTSSTPDTYPSTPLYLSLPSIDISSQVRNSLQAILASCNTSDKWSQLAPALALEILRSTTASLSRLPQFEIHLAFHLSNTHSSFYQAAEDKILKQLLPTLQKLVNTYTSFTSQQIFEAATAPRPTTSGSTAQIKEEVDDVATRIAHIGILHWRVWAQLAYLVDATLEHEEQSFERARSMP